ncbi:hypothetical protein Tsubulata_017028 [Turnera subulata]|uniref:Uncharacterized protein n=1 Tax=Turnera subulata TaxID=218843 RepID=A0A9Q0FHR1_9ROSI|nr:hypothetical protein Tsubulata_017028 [Turnera subulata]
MDAEDNETFNGWPLGLEIMNTRLRVMESLQAAPTEQYSFRMPSPSFSSFSSSNLDTESTASFFQDNSVSLGRLIGLRPRDGELYIPGRMHLDKGQKISVRVSSSEVSTGRRVDMSQGICIPLLLGTIEKMSRSKSKSR